jgi:glutamate synthase domain-containing protein 3
VNRGIERVEGEEAPIVYDLAAGSVRELNQRLHDLPRETNARQWQVLNPKGAHAVAAGLKLAVGIEIKGHVGYYCAGMNQNATVVVDGHAGTGVAENMMSGLVRVKGDASQSAGASGRGGLLVIEGDAGARCGISMKGIDIVVGGSAGHMSCFMGQAGSLVVCGDVGHDLGDSLYEAEIFVAGRLDSLGADCIEKEMEGAHLERVASLLERAQMRLDPRRFRRYGSARRLYNFHVDHAGEY